MKKKKFFASLTLSLPLGVCDQLSLSLYAFTIESFTVGLVVGGVHKEKKGDGLMEDGGWNK
jgi:hypothetical protein